MKDRNNLTICDGDTVEVQTTPDGPKVIATVGDADSYRARESKSVLVQFSNGTAQYMGGEHLTVIHD